MSNKLKTVEWEGNRLVHWMLAEIEEMRRNIVKMNIEDVTGEPLDNIDLVDEKKLVYENHIVDGLLPGNPSKLSIDSTIALMLNYGDFYLPEEAKQFIKECFENDALAPERLPDNEDLLESGKAILDAFMAAEYPYYAACALTGATFIECGWNVNVYNALEKNGGGVPGTAGWENCGEGLFGLTFWKQKEKIIKALGSTSPPVSSELSIYRLERCPQPYVHLCDLNEEYWCQMAKIYLGEIASKDNEILLREELTSDTEYLESLAAAYLWKAACGLEPEWEKAIETSEKYQATHTRQNNGKPAMNAFAQQLCVSVFLDKYIHGEENLSLYDIGIEFEVDLTNDGYKTSADNIRNSYKYGEGGSASGSSINGISGGNMTQQIKPLEPGLFKKNPKGWDIKKACEWINQNSTLYSQHACAKFVRMAIEAGGISTNGRPTWAWKYIDYLPTIGFEFLQKVKKEDAKTFNFEPGDIAVYQKNGNPDVPGHICMWTGQKWCSDFKQNNMIVYGNTPEAYVFRFKGATNSNEKNK